MSIRLLVLCFPGSAIPLVPIGLAQRHAHSRLHVEQALHPHPVRFDFGVRRFFTEWLFPAPKQQAETSFEAAITGFLETRQQEQAAFAALVSIRHLFEYASRRLDLPLAAVKRVKYDNRSGRVVLPGGVAQTIRSEARDARCESPQLRGVDLSSDHAERRERDEEHEGSPSLLGVAPVNRLRAR